MGGRNWAAVGVLGGVPTQSGEGGDGMQSLGLRGFLRTVPAKQSEQAEVEGGEKACGWAGLGRGA